MLVSIAITEVCLGIRTDGWFSGVGMDYGITLDSSSASIHVQGSAHVGYDHGNGYGASAEVHGGASAGLDSKNGASAKAYAGGNVAANTPMGSIGVGGDVSTSGSSAHVSYSPPGVPAKVGYDTSRGPYIEL